MLSSAEGSDEVSALQLLLYLTLLVHLSPAVACFDLNPVGCSRYIASSCSL